MSSFFSQGSANKSDHAASYVFFSVSGALLLAGAAIIILMSAFCGGRDDGRAARALGLGFIDSLLLVLWLPPPHRQIIEFQTLLYIRTLAQCDGAVKCRSHTLLWVWVWADTIALRFRQIAKSRNRFFIVFPAKISHPPLRWKRKTEAVSRKCRLGMCKEHYLLNGFPQPQ
jgi:hypothetical protein